MSDHPLLHDIEMLFSADPYDHIGRGNLRFLAMSSQPAVAAAAKDLLERIDAAPRRTDRYEPPVKIVDAVSEYARPLTDDERAYVTTLAARRDQLTEDEANKLAAIRRQIEPGVGRDLVDDALAPTMTSIEEAKRADEAAEIRWKLQHMPERLVAIDSGQLASIERALAERFEAELSDVPEAGKVARIRAQETMSELSNAAKARRVEQRAELEQSLRDLAPVTPPTPLFPTPTAPAPAPPPVSEPLPPAKPRPIALPNGKTMPGELLEDFVAYLDGDLSNEQRTVFEAKYQAATGISLAPDPMTPVHLSNGKWIPLAWGDEYMAACKGELSPERTEAVLSKVNAHLAAQDDPPLGGDAA